MAENTPYEQQEEGIEVPYQQISPEALQRMVQEFVTRDGADWGEAGCSLEDKVRQVQRQLQAGQVRVVFDLRTQTANIVPCR